MSLVASNLSLARDGVSLLKGISATFSRGELTVVIGRTLAGKTTLLRAIAGLQTIDEGDFLLDGKPFGQLPTWKRDVAMVYQQFINYPHLTVFENVAFPLRKKRVPDVETHVRDVLQAVGLAEFSARKPSELSGGQQQRVALARALVRQAEILLLDEPLVNLDYKLREQLREDFRRLLATQAHSVVIFNTTEPAEAMMIADKIIVMHEGRILQIGAPADVYETPASICVARVINDPPMNIMAGRLESEEIILDAGLRLAVPERLATLPAGKYRFGLRAGDIPYGRNGTQTGQVTFSEVSGSETTLHAKGLFGQLVLQLEGVFSMPLQAEIRVEILPECLFVYADEADGRLISAPPTKAAL